MKPRAVIIIVLGVISIGTILGYQALKASKSSGSSKPGVATSSGEELNSQGTRRPVQYVHICDTPDSSIEYVSQGTPKCLGSDDFQSDYDPSVPGTVYSSPCKTDTGPLRYVYISNDEKCPDGTTLLFYNSLGGSTTGDPSPYSNSSSSSSSSLITD